MTLTELLDRAKERTGSDPKTADLIGVAKARISEIRSGKASLTNEGADRLANLVGVPWHVAVAAAEAHRAKDERNRAKWLKKTELGTTLVVGLLLVAATLIPSGAHARAGINNLERNQQVIHYALFKAVKKALRID